GGFNPCCSGSRSRSPRAGRHAAGVDVFQSLLFWITVTFSPSPTSGGGGCRFQSLLFLIPVTFPGWGGPPSRGTAGFNSCCFGSRSGSGRHDLPRRSVAAVSILVVLDHGQVPRRWPSTAARATCFNPCCSGSRSGSDRGRAMSTVVFVFQSLLFWITVRFSE